MANTFLIAKVPRNPDQQDTDNFELLAGTYATREEAMTEVRFIQANQDPVISAVNWLFTKELWVLKRVERASFDGNPLPEERG